MMLRRDFLTATGAMAAGALLGSRHAGAKTGLALRTIAYNVYACKGWPERKGNRARLAIAQPQIHERIAMELAMYRPNLVTLSEAPKEAIVARIAHRLQMKHVYFKGGFSGALLTHLPIRESENLSLASCDVDAREPFTRHLGCAVLDTPAGPLSVYSAHLNPHHEDVRLREIAAILGAIAPDRKAHRAVLLQGDLNHRPNTPEYAKWIEAGMTDAFALKGTGIEGTVTSIRPKARIDYVWMDGPLTGRLTETRTLFEGAFRVNPDDPASFALSDHLPVMANFA